jgi:L-fuculose-phosphate aldolase
MNEAIDEMRSTIARLGALLFSRQVLDIAGGNISARVGQQICITPRYAGSRRQWQLRPDQVLVMDLAGNKLEGEGEISREAKVHVRLYRDFPDGQAVVHAHPQHVLVFCAARRPIPPVLEATLKFGEVKVVEYAPAHSQELAEYIARGLCGQEEHIRKQAAAVIAPWHGLFVIGKDLEAAVDAAERINTNAGCLLFARLLGSDQPLGAESSALVSAIAAYKS